ncbi:hypothetical protein Baya_16817 [Bagarius yarrelli]|uniref:Uncharacterized protein n=1 Tax=Bagarius yarrelli TaxID=175774 RepID=A0A556VWV8_BAGYA|nr:hypothetical protein Baya_16817 [Bagarius yarrelli]
MGDTCSHKLSSAKLLKLFIIIILPCVCGLICLLTLLLTFTGIIGNGLLDSSDSAPFSSTDVSMVTLIPLLAVTVDRHTLVNATATTSDISTDAFYPQSPSTEPLMSDSDPSPPLFPVDATPTPTDDWLLSFSTMSTQSSVEPTSAEAGLASEVQDGDDLQGLRRQQGQRSWNKT